MSQSDLFPGLARTVGKERDCPSEISDAMKQESGAAGGCLCCRQKEPETEVNTEKHRDKAMDS